MNGVGLGTTSYPHLEQHTFGDDRRWHPQRIVVPDIALHSPGGRAQSTFVGVEVQMSSDPCAKVLENPIALPRANALAHEKDVDILREAIHKPVHLGQARPIAGERCRALAGACVSS